MKKTVTTIELSSEERTWIGLTHRRSFVMDLDPLSYETSDTTDDEQPEPENEPETRTKEAYKIKNLLLAVTIGFIFTVACSRTDSVNAESKAAKSVAEPVIQSSSADPQPAATPQPVVQINKDTATLALEFYRFYLDGFPRVEDETPAVLRYLTPKFLDQAMKADDYDVFLDAQDMDESWTSQSVSVSRSAITGSKATVDVSLDGNTLKWVLKVSLVKKGDVWKIDGVKNKG